MHDDSRPEPEDVTPPDAVDESDVPAPPPPPPMPAAPVTGAERILTLDLLRGFALLGILAINVWAYGLPFPAAMNPDLAGYHTALDKVMFVIVYMTVYTKTMPIFSMLFGAGVLLLAARMEERGRKPWRFVLGRQWWLLVFGLIHSYLMWNGDILVPYAFAGTIAFLFRRRRPRTLLILALFCFLLPKLGMQGMGYFMADLQEAAVEARVAQAAGDTLTSEQEEQLERYESQMVTWAPTPEQIDELIAIYRGPVSGRLAHDAKETAVMHLFLYPVFIGWNIIGYMLLGMMLFKTGVMTGERDRGFYRRMAGICYGLGVPLSLLGAWLYDSLSASFVDVMRYAFTLTEVAGPLVALGHIGLLILAFGNGWFPDLQVRLRAVGRMAFTNYISHTVICTTIFYGHGFGQWGDWNRAELMLLALVIWALQLWWSPWWLARFRFGPLEWLWRSMSYGSRQPFRVGMG